MKRETNQNEREKLERRLAALVPVENEELATNILSQLAEKPFPALDSAFATGQTQPDASPPVHHASCVASTLPLLAGLCGGMIGAALMFLIMTAFTSPKVEVREVVRYVQVEVPAEVPQPEAETPPETLMTEEETRPAVPKVKPSTPRELPWFLAMLKPLTALEANAGRYVAMNDPRDVDAMLKRHNELALARQAHYQEPRLQLIQYKRSNVSPSEFSPLMYKDIVDWGL